MLRAQADPARQLVWFEARRPIAAGEELTFAYNDWRGARWRPVIVAVWMLLVAVAVAVT